MSTTQQRIFIPLNVRIVLNYCVEFKPPHEPYPLTWANYLIDVIRYYIAGEYELELEFPKGCAIYTDSITSDTVINQVDQWDLWGFIHLIAQENGVALPDNGHPVVPFDEEAYRELVRSKQQRRYGGENAGGRSFITSSSKGHCTYQREHDDHCDGREENPHTHGHDGHVGS